MTTNNDGSCLHCHLARPLISAVRLLDATAPHLFRPFSFREGDVIANHQAVSADHMFLFEVSGLVLMLRHPRTYHTA
jgi:hypothetical protein